MGRFKKALSLFLALILVLTSMPLTAFAGSDDLSLRINALWVNMGKDPSEVDCDQYIIDLQWNYSATATETGYELRNSSGTVIEKDIFDTTLHEGLVGVAWPVYTIYADGIRTGSLETGKTYFYQGYIVVDGVKHWSEKKSFVFSTEGSRYGHLTPPDIPGPDVPEPDVSEPGVETPMTKSGKFEYYSIITGKTEKYSYYYDDAWFLKSSTNYNHKLAQMSIRSAISAARTSAVSIKKLFDDLGFDYTNDSIHYPTPTPDTIGYAIGSKLINNNGESVRIIAVAVRGGGYKSEWADNFEIGTTSEHSGFANAGNKVYEAVKDYIAETRKSGETVKIWLTGYSRAAAVANIAAQRLTGAARREEIRGLSTNGVFAYCFECPRNVRTDHPAYTAYTYSNIFNIVNHIDFVPKVAPEDWKFSRYGITYFLPSNELKTKNYFDSYNSMKKNYSKIIDATSFDGNADTKANKLAGHMSGQGKFLDQAVDALASFFSSQSTYAYGYQSTITSLFKTFNGGTYEAGTALSLIVEGIPAFPILHPIITTKLAANAGNIGNAHYPELCLAWMDTLAGQYEYVNSRTRYLYVNCPVNVSVYLDGILVAQIIDDVVQEIPDSTIDAYIDEDGQKVFILPCDAEFDIVIEATDSGKMTYTVTEYDVDTGSTLKATSYQELALTEGETFTANVPTKSENEQVRYTLSIGGNELTPTLDLDEYEISEFNVSVTAVGGGNVSGGGKYINGEYAKFTALPNEGNQFLGWYINGALVSTDLQYRCLVNSDLEVIGQFTGDSNNNDTRFDLSLPSRRIPITYKVNVENNAGGTVTANYTDAEVQTNVKLDVVPDKGYELDTLTVTSSNKNVETVLRYGVYSFVMPLGDVTVSATFKKSDTATESYADVCPGYSTCPIHKYTDLNADVHYEGIHYCVERDILRGVSNDLFMPFGITDRSTAITALWRLAGNPVVNYALNFSDVSEDMWYTEAIRWATSEKIINGYGDGRFGVSDLITREQFATILYRYVQNNGGGFKGMWMYLMDFNDLENVSDWAYEALAWMNMNNVITGRPGKILDPKKYTTRAEAATIFYRLSQCMIEEK